MCPPGLPATHILFCTRFFFPHFATCQLCAHLAYLPIFFPQIDLSPWPAVEATIRLTQERPAYQQAMAVG